MASFNKFDSFVENLAEGVINLQSDALKVVLTDTAPVATDSVFADLTEISAGNGYTAGGVAATVASSSQSGGTYKLVVDDVTITASGGSIGPFRYFVLIDDTPTSPAKPLIGWWDYGASITLNDGESVTVDFDGTNGVLQIA
ncbi:MAG: hypothetical protein WBP94_02420 [Rhodomicrobiaceae bacterium]